MTSKDVEGCQSSLIGKEHPTEHGPWADYNQPPPPYEQQIGGAAVPPPAPVIVVQPGKGDPRSVVMAPILQNPPPDHLFFNIIVTIFCCWPIGICAIMKSVATRNAILRADSETALRMSKKARSLGYYTLGCGIVIILVMVIVRFLVPMLTSNYDNM